MNKTLIALAVLAAAGSVSAQSSVTLFGVADLSYTRVESDTTVLGIAGNVTRTGLVSGSNRTSRIGFRGTEDLGSGLKAGFWLEAGVSLDSGASASTGIFTNNQAAGTQAVAGIGGGSGALAFNRRANVMLSGNFGEFRVGRSSVAGLLAQESFDPFDANGVGGIRQIVYANARTLNGATTTNLATSGPTVRASNMIEYFLPSNLGGFNGTVGYGFGENPDTAGATKDNGNLFTFRVGYTNGPFDIKVAGTTYDFTNTAAIVNDYSEYTVGGSYDFSVVKVFLAFNSNKVDNHPTDGGDGKTDSIILSATAPFGDGLFRAVYVKANQKTTANNDGSQFSIGYIHNLSKRTSLYATYALADNKGASTRFNVGGGLGVTTAGGKSSGFDLGVTHAF
ncbi:MAG: porin [Burkholderiaceae bacterium]